MKGEISPRQRPQVILYSKPGCHLCDEAEREIKAARCADIYHFEKVNIETDPVLLRRHGWEIPVITINGTVVFKYKLTAEEFRRAIEKITERGFQSID